MRNNKSLSLVTRRWAVRWQSVQEQLPIDWSAHSPTSVAFEDSEKKKIETASWFISWQKFALRIITIWANCFTHACVQYIPIVRVVWRRDLRALFRSPPLQVSTTNRYQTKRTTCQRNKNKNKYFIWCRLFLCENIRNSSRQSTKRDWRFENKNILKNTNFVAVGSLLIAKRGDNPPLPPLLPPPATTAPVFADATTVAPREFKIACFYIYKQKNCL